MGDDQATSPAGPRADGAVPGLSGMPDLPDVHRDGPGLQRRPGTAGPAGTADHDHDGATRSVLRSSQVMAFGTITSRITGLMRTLLAGLVLGTTAVADSYNFANVIPNMVYEMLLGGVLTSVVVPLIVTASRRDDDDGEAYAQRLLTVVIAVLGAATILTVVFAPQITSITGVFVGSDHDETGQGLTTLFARFFLPQILFYGVGATIGAILNTRNRFAAPMWAPVLNNVVVMITWVAFLAVPGPASGELDVDNISTAQVWTLGIGTTLGIVLQTVALLPSLRRVGFRLRLRRDLRGTGLGQAARVGGWMFLYVGVNLLGYVWIAAIAKSQQTRSEGIGFSVYSYAFLLFQLPNAVVGVSIITALLPRMSRYAADGQLRSVSRELSRGLRLASVVLVPAAFGYLALGQPIAHLLFFRRTANSAAIGWTLAAFSVGLVAWSIFYLHLRGFYALKDTRTPALINVVVNAANLAVDLLLLHVLPARWVVPGLGLGYASSYVIGSVLTWRVLSRRLGGLDGFVIGRTLARLAVSAGCAAILALGAYLGLEALAGDGFGGSLLELVVAAPLGLACYVLVARRLRVHEIHAATDLLAAKLPGVRRPRPAA